MKSLNRVIREERIKNIIQDMFFLLVVFIFAYLFNKWIEMLTFIVTFTVIRCEFIKAVHGSDFTKSAVKGIKYCRYITFVVQIISLVFIINVDISKYINILLAVILGIINFLAKDYLQYIYVKTIFYKGMTIDEMPKDLVGIEKDLMVQYYIKRYKLDKIAFNLGYSIDNIKKMKAKIIKKYS